METERVEYKRYVDFNENKQKHNLIFEIIAFLNTKGGTLYIGKNDDGSIHPIENIHKYEEKLTNILRTAIVPTTVGEVEIIVYGEYIEVVVASGSNKPYAWISKMYSPEGCYKRLGTSKFKMEQSEIDKMLAMRSYQNLTTVNAPKQNLTFKQLEADYLKKDKIFDENMIKSLDFINERGFNQLAYLLSDQLEEYVAYTKYGADSDFPTTINFKGGNIVTIYEEVLNFLTKELQRSKITGNGVRQDYNLIDLRVLREVLTNAFVHTDYSYQTLPSINIYDDKIEIISRGKFNVTEEEFKENIPMARNPRLMEIFLSLGFVEKRAIGSRTILLKYPFSIYKLMENSVKVVIAFDVAQSKGDVAQGKGDVAQGKGYVAQSKGDVAQSKGDVAQSKGDVAQSFEMVDRELLRAIRIIAKDSLYVTSKNLKEAYDKNHNSKTIRQIQRDIRTLEDKGYIKDTGVKDGRYIKYEIIKK